MTCPRALAFIAVALTAPARAAVAVDFDHEIVPILRAHCTECHGGDKKKGGFSINTRADVMAGSENGKTVVAGRSGESVLIKLISSSDPDEQMPPKGARLTADEVKKLASWIDAELPWTSGFVFKKPSYEPPLKPRRPKLPAAAGGRENPIDRLLDAHLAATGSATPAPLGDGAFFRRVHLDLVGLLPEPDALAAFLADPAPDKRTRIIRDLLADSQGYAEHWLTFWNDMLRNDYAGTGYIDGGRQQISAWLYEALLENKPYDAFVRELVAPTPESEGFAKGIKWRGTVSAGQSVPIQFAQSVSQAFLGINLKCASCHDSFIDRWKLDDAYGLAAVYASEPLALFRCDVPSGRTATAAWLFPELGQIEAARPPAERLQQLAALMTHPENGRLTRTVVNRLWHRLMGRGIVHPVDAMQTEPWNADLLDYLAVDLADHRYDLKSTLALICTSQAYQSVAELIESDSASEYHFAGPRAKRLTAEELTDAIWQITGTAPRKIDAPVRRPGPAGSPIEALTARWIWTRDQQATPADAGESATFRTTVTLAALPARAAAAVTCDNGFTLWLNGQKLATGDEWASPVAVDLRPALRAGTNDLRVTGTNGGSGPNPAGLIVEGRFVFADGTTQTLASNADWRWTRRPPAGNGQLAPVPDDWQPAIELDGATWAAGVHDRLRSTLAEALSGGGRMVRASLLRSDPLMRALGRPNREQIVSTRPNDLTTLEAMDLNNGALLTSRLEEGAAALQGRPWASSDALVHWLFAFAFSRAPSADELSLATEALTPSPTPAAIQDLLWAVIMQPEFQLIR